MVQNRQVTLLGDSILKGIQVDLGDRRYRTHNEINVEALESEFQLSIHNDAHFGATVRKGSRLLDRMLARKLPCDMMVMDFGGNDCDFRWKEIAEDPTGDHQPNVPLPEFVELYREMIRRVRSHGIRPILTNLPPLDSERFFNWWCGDLDKEAVMRWLGDVGNIYVWQEMLPDGCRVRVLDNGRGIPPEALAHLTEAFYRVDKSRSRAQGGAGLGLSLCNEIVQLHGGTMQFESRVGNGTVVTVELKGGRV